MIDKTFNNLVGIINNNDIANLRNYEENGMLDYKEGAPLLGDDKNKEEFAADVVSFANTAGGILIYGIREKNGVPEEIVPFSVDDLQKGIDTLKLKIDQILKSKITPELYGCKIESINQGEKFVLIIKISKSFNAPHAVVKSSGECRFYGRRQAGKKEIYSYNEIKNAFTLNESLNEKIRKFRHFRTNQIINNETPLPLNNNPKIILHLTPLSAFSENKAYDIEQFYNNRVHFPAIAEACTVRPHVKQPNTQRRNLEGILFHYSCDKNNSYQHYIQVYRNGIVESVDGAILEIRENQKIILGGLYEKQLIFALANYIEAYKLLGVDPPIVLALTFTDVKNYYMYIDYQKYPYDRSEPILSDELILPEIIMTNLNEPPEKILKPIFDLVWNACGFAKSLNYDEQNNFLFN
ncbi:MAG: hypothetical protein Tsb005_09850 [Gammaproteobacteria bacterium]